MADISVTSTAVQGGKGVSALAAVIITAGEVVYLDTSGNANLADNTAALTAAVAGIALNDAQVNQPVGILKTGILTMNGVLTAGVVYTLSGLANPTTPAPGTFKPAGDAVSSEFVTVIGVAMSATTLNISINASGVQKA